MCIRDRVIAVGTHTGLLADDPAYRALVARGDDLDDDLDDEVPAQAREQVSR